VVDRGAVSHASLRGRDGASAANNPA
jgi:hypothetical protein